MDITTLAEKRGFFFPTCEIYADAQAGFWEYGPLGSAMKRKYIELWRKMLVRKAEMLEIDGSQIMSKNVFLASGHLSSFQDPIVKCKKCNAIHRADRLIQEKTGKIIPEKLKLEQYDKLIKEHDIKCPSCKSVLEKTEFFNMMFKVGIGAEGKEAYLRPETCQSIFVDFSRLYKIMRCKLPIAFAQIGKVFRNEISPRQCLLRLREFNQAEIEVFFNPKKAGHEKFNSLKNYKLRLADNEGNVNEISCEEALKKKILPNELIAYYLSLLQQFYEKTGINVKKSRFRKLSDEEKAFYAETAYDFEVLTNLGWIELVACNYRTDYDLAGHEKTSKQDMHVDDEGKVLPHVFELSMGIDRSLFCILDNAYEKEKLEKEERELLKLQPFIAPTTIAIFPLVSKDGLDKKAKEIYEMLKQEFDCFYDESGSIGRRYRRQDEIGTPFCLTVDYETMKSNAVTLRERDSMKQERVKILEIAEKINSLLKT